MDRNLRNTWRRERIRFASEHLLPSSMRRPVCEVGDLVDTEEITEEMKQKPWWGYDLRAKEGYEHGVVGPAVCQKLYECLRCSKRSIFGKALWSLFWPSVGQCEQHLEGVSEHRWKGKVLGQPSAASRRCG